MIAIRGMLMEADLGVPLFVEGVIERMVGMLRFFRLGDGGLALFNGGKGRGRLPDRRPWPRPG